MKSPFLQRIDTWNKLLKKGEKLPAAFGVPRRLHDQHQKKIQKRFFDYCYHHRITLKIYEPPTHNLFNKLK